MRSARTVEGDHGGRRLSPGNERDAGRSEKRECCNERPGGPTNRGVAGPSPRMRSLAARVTVTTLVVNLLVAAVLCASAGTLRFWRGWAVVGQVWLVMMATNAYLLRVAPALVESRLVSKREPRATQRAAKAGMYLSLLALLVTAGLDRREGWSQVPPALVALGFVALAVGALVVFLVLRENRHAAIVVHVADGQAVVSTGPYRWVRHPMYLGFLLQGLALPLALGSYWAEAFSLAACLVVVTRLLDEERLLRADLSGYVAYAARTRHRLVPGVW
jgi:protein-S-isoprenylcysteine O-methyltransferase Ste14